ncbi:MAG: heavy metal translocating P-type ATPase [Bacilli bacterium]
MENEKQTVNHEKEEHNHEQGRSAIIFFFIGLVLFIVSLFVKDNIIIKNILCLIAMIFSGYHIIIEGIESTISSSKTNGKFSPNVHILMFLAALGASLIGDFQEGALLIVIFAGAHFLEDYAEGRSKKEITNLLKMNPTEARLIQTDDSNKIVDVATLQIGDHLQVLNGDQVPTDGIILSGYTSIDESSINGESIPKEKQKGDEVFGSTINGTGSFTMEVTKDSKDTLFAKIITLVNQSQSNLSKTATKIQILEPKYVKIVMVIVPTFILLARFAFDWTWYDSFYRGMVFLTAASPCALAASAIPATLSAISNLAKQGILFKGGSYLANLAYVKSVSFDKTGTLTQGKPVVTDYHFSEDEQASIDIIIAMEKTANHPLANAILESFSEKDILSLDVTNEIGKGLVTTHNNEEYRIGKPETFENVNEEMSEWNSTYANEGKTVVYYSKNEVVIGIIAMMDIAKDKVKEMISYLKEKDIHTVMITGDSQKTGEAIGKQLGIDEIIGNVLPENKSKIIDEQKAKYGTAVMLGDGVNDAPALVSADIGFAMGDGTDIAMDVADAVIMNNDLSKLPYAHNVAKRLDHIVWQNVFISMAVVAYLVIMNIIGKMNLPLGVLIHEVSTLVVIANSLRLLIPNKVIK